MLLVFAETIGAAVFSAYRLQSLIGQSASKLTKYVYAVLVFSAYRLQSLIGPVKHIDLLDEAVE